MPIKQVKMGRIKLTKLKSHLQFSIPEELYNIEPGQVVFFVPVDGLNQHDVRDLRGLSLFLNFVRRDNEVKISIVPTSDEALTFNFAGRNQQEIGIPYKVIVSNGESVAGFAAQYFGEDVKKIMERFEERAVTLPEFSAFAIGPTVLPIIVEIDPNNRPVKKSSGLSGESSDDYDTELLTKRPETDKEKGDLIANREQKIKKILWECAYLGIDLDIKSIADEIEAGKSETSDYELSLKMTPAKAGTIDCKISVREDMELVLKQPILKAVYLTFLSLEDGLVIESATPDFTKRIQKIYRSLPDREEKEEEKDGTGIMYVQYIQSKTLRGYMSEINSAIAKLIPNGLAAIEFSIEGEKEKAFKVMRSTPEIRKQIISAFNL